MVDGRCNRRRAIFVSFLFRLTAVVCPVSTPFAFYRKRVCPVVENVPFGAQLGLVLRPLTGTFGPVRTSESVESVTVSSIEELDIRSTKL